MVELGYDPIRCPEQGIEIPNPEINRYHLFPDRLVDVTNKIDLDSFSQFLFWGPSQNMVKAVLFDGFMWHSRTLAQEKNDTLKDQLYNEVGLYVVHIDGSNLQTKKAREESKPAIDKAMRSRKYVVYL